MVTGHGNELAHVLVLEFPVEIKKFRVPPQRAAAVAAEVQAVDVADVEATYVEHMSVCALWQRTQSPVTVQKFTRSRTRTFLSRPGGAGIHYGPGGERL